MTELSDQLASMATVARAGQSPAWDPELVDVSKWADELEEASRLLSARATGETWKIWHTPAKAQGLHKSYIDGPPAGDWAGAGVEVARVGDKEAILEQIRQMSDEDLGQVLSVAFARLDETGDIPMSIRLRAFADRVENLKKQGETS
jgi:hypothetical protein